MMQNVSPVTINFSFNKYNLMKKILSIALVTFSMSSLSAQDMTVNESKPRFGIRGGVNFQTINGKDAGNNNLENDLLTGFHGGVSVEIPLGSGLYVQPGVLYAVKGAKLQNSEAKVKLGYMEVPVHLIYKPVLGTGNMILGFGPYIGLGLGGKLKDGGSETDVEFSNKEVSNLNYTQFRKTDGGANFLAGYEFANKLSFQLNAQLGLTNINPELDNGSTDNNRWRNTGWGLSLGYRL
jgi:hypothetical protein